MRLFNLSIHKGNEKMGIRNKEKGESDTGIQREQENGNMAGACMGPSLLSELDPF
jgi:hypothetical protein